jgi:hypothetical protein
VIATFVARPPPSYAPVSLLARSLQSWSSLRFAKGFANDSQGDKRMRYLRLFCAAMLLTCALAFSAYAGNIECDGKTTATPLTEVIVALVESVLSLV